MKKIFLTGITGLVGSAFVVALLRERQDCEFVCLARKSAVKSARQRTEEIIRDECKFDGCPELADRILSKVSVIEGDVVDLDPVEMAKNPLLEGVNVVFHCAADVNLGQDPTGRTFRINYQGSKNIVELAKLLK
ncbi:MAG: NAD-dependent epimerase/dehydratase family protein, partial [Lentisphaeria bacterium]|nr:NAD-dependent epimerase/dehydratase family protein [Lentisphaeria bacterium]